MSIVDHNTANRFRGNRLESAFKDIFSQVVLLLAEEALASLRQAFADGAKIEAQANRHTFAWANAVKTNKEKMLRQLEGSLEIRPKRGKGGGQRPGAAGV